MHKHHTYILYTRIHTYVYVISALYTLCIFSLFRNFCESEHGHEHGNVQWTSLSPLLFLAEVCQCQMCPQISPHSPALLARGQLENLNRRKCCKLCRQHFSLVAAAAAKKEEVSQLALAFILTGIFLGNLSHTHTPIHMRLTTLGHTHTYILYLFLNGLPLN